MYMFVHLPFGGKHDFRDHHVTETLEVDRRSFLRVEFGYGTVRQSDESVDFFFSRDFCTCTRRCLFRLRPGFLSRILSSLPHFAGFEWRQRIERTSQVPGLSGCGRQTVAMD